MKPFVAILLVGFALNLPLVVDNRAQTHAFGACANRRFSFARSHNRFRPAQGPPIDGEFIEVVFTTDFEKKKSVTERVSAMKEGDGVWRVFAYDARTSQNNPHTASP